MSQNIQELIDSLNGLSPAALAEIDKLAKPVLEDRYWTPNAGPQMDAYYCEADELFFGGSAGSSKSDLLIGLSLQEHQRSLILRRTNHEVKGLVDRYEQIIGSREQWSGQHGRWTLPGRIVALGGCQLEGDKQKYKGNPRDFYGFDEVSDFSESQYKFITGWNRSTDIGQRCRVVAAGNPPTTPEGLWVIQYWAPWLDPRHPNPAKPGELRWFVAGREVDGPGQYEVPGSDKPARAKSRTFIPGFLDDNPDLAQTDYDSTLADMPDEMRAAYREGRFDVALKENPWQIIPTAWIRAAQDRWEPEPPRGIPMCAIGVDVAQGGDDNTVLAMRYDGWYAPNIKVPGKETPDGSSVAALVVLHRRDQAMVIMDMGGGYGGAPYERLLDNNLEPGKDIKKYKGANESRRRTDDKAALPFYNKRAEVYWRFREALDPDQFGGSTIALPEDPAMVADLTAVTWKRGRNNCIQAIPKEELVKKLGRSPDDGDAVVMAWSEGPTTKTHINQWRPDNRVGRFPRQQMPKYDMGPRFKNRSRRK